MNTYCSVIPQSSTFPMNFAINARRFAPHMPYTLVRVRDSVKDWDRVRVRVEVRVMVRVRIGDRDRDRVRDRARVRVRVRKTMERHQKSCL